MPTETTTGTTVRGLDLAFVYTTNPERAIAFYRDVIGLTPTEVDDQGRGAEFTLADGSTYGVWNPGEADQKPQGGVMFAVDDARAKVEEIRSRGGQISDVMESPVCVMAFGQDLDGNPFIIHQRTKKD